MFLSRGDRDLGVAFQTHPGRQAFISSGSKEPRSALEWRRESLGAHLQITLDIMNLTNLFNRNWGAAYFLDDWKLSPVEVTALTDDGKGNKTPSYRFVGGEISQNDLLSRWRMQLGVRVVF